MKLFNKPNEKAQGKAGWLVIVVALIFIIAIFVSLTKNDKEEDRLSKAGLNFSVHKVNNDVTGNWRISTIAEKVQMQDYAVDYYKKYFKSDSEIHAIVNFNYNTTTRIIVMPMFKLLDVCVFEYVDKEEHDAKVLFSGQMLSAYHVNIDTGEIEKID